MDSGATMTQHTPGRLKIGRIDHENQHVEIDAESTRAHLNCFPWENLATCYGEERNPERGSAVMEANARRLVAAWNALDGIPTTDIEAAARSGSIAYALSKVITQRDELLAALNLLKAWDFGAVVVTAEDEKLMDGVAAFARAAIAKAEGGEA